jgi:hypothetical protein
LISMGTISTKSARRNTPANIPKSGDERGYVR